MSSSNPRKRKAPAERAEPPLNLLDSIADDMFKTGAAAASTGTGTRDEREVATLFQVREMPLPNECVSFFDALGRDMREYLLPLVCFRSLACTCYHLRQQMNETLLQPVLHVRPADATWDNACYVAQLLTTGSSLQTLRIAGERCLPDMQLRQYQTLPRLKVGEIGVPAAIFLGAAVARCDAAIRLCDGKTIRTLAGLREQGGAHVPFGASQADAAVLLGAISLNKEFIGLYTPRPNQLPPTIFRTTDPLLAAACKDAFRAKTSSRANVIRAVRRNAARALESASAELRADAEIARLAVAQDPCALEFVRDPGSDWYEQMVLKAVSQNGTLLQYASPRLRSDTVVVLAALRRTASAYEHIDESIAGLPSVVSAVSKALMGPDSLSLRERLRTPLPFFESAASMERVVLRWFDHGGMRYIEPHLKRQLMDLSCYLMNPRNPRVQALLSCRPVALRILERWPKLFEVCSAELRADPLVALTAVQQDGRLLKFASDALRADREVVLAALHRNAAAAAFIIGNPLAPGELLAIAGPGQPAFLAAEQS